ncbi:MAG: phosphatase PAP2 family protein [Proteobacteria bacterium]|nr:phosphatase PAP2 family protein [Pseudomonadota bacterium]
MPYYVANGFLIFTDSLLIIPLVLLGFLWISRFAFYHAVALMLVSMIINVALKISFQIPLSPSLHKAGFAFPSGHMQLASVFYLFLAYQFKKTWLTTTIFFLLTGIGFGLIYFGYHNIYDVVAAFITALILVFSYLFSIKQAPKITAWLLLGLASLLLSYIHWHYPPIAGFVWGAYFTLWGITLAEKMSSKKPNTKLISEKILASLLCLILIAIVQLCFAYVIDGKKMPAYLAEMHWLIVGFIIPSVDFYAIALLNWKRKRRRRRRRKNAL